MGEGGPVSVKDCSEVWVFREAGEGSVGCKGSGNLGRMGMGLCGVQWFMGAVKGLGWTQ